MTKYVVTPEQMKKAEAFCENNGTSLAALMDNAGKAIAGYTADFLPIPEEAKIVILCGGGNNGGDGFVAAKELSRIGANVYVMALSEPSTELCRDAFDRCKAGTSGELVTVSEGIDTMREYIQDADVIVDCIFGTGFHGEIEPVTENENPYTVHIRPVTNIIKAANESKAIKISADIPSGCNALTGEAAKCVFEADYTLVLGAYKTGHMHSPCSEYSGELSLADIGIPDSAYKEYEAIVSEDSVIEKLPKRKRISHKGDYGRLLNIAGSENYVGAAWLSTNAALRVGTGHVTLCSVKSITTAVSITLHESTYLPLTDKSNIETEHINDILSAAENATAVLIGCGTGCNEDIAKITLSLIKYAGCPVIIDADGLNSIAPHINEIKDNNGMVILTPHLKEFSRLSGCDMGYIQKNKLAAAKLFAKMYNVHLLLKDAYSVYAAPDGFTAVNLSGNDALAKAGSGDTLAGTIAGLLAIGGEINNTVAAGAYIFGKAAEHAAIIRSTRSILPSEIPETYSQIFY